MTELITNGTFDTDVSGWSANKGTIAWDAAGQSGGCLKTTTDATTYGFAYQAITTEVGKTYVLLFYAKKGTSGYNLGVAVGTSIGGTQNLYQRFAPTGWELVEYQFTATGTTTYVQPLTYGTATGQYDYWDGISVQELDEESSSSSSSLTSSSSSSSVTSSSSSTSSSASSSSSSSLTSSSSQSSSSSELRSSSSSSSSSTSSSASSSSSSSLTSSSSQSSSSSELRSSSSSSSSSTSSSASSSSSSSSSSLTSSSSATSSSSSSSPTSSSSSRVPADSTQAAILEAVRDRLRAALVLDANQCYVTLTPLSPIVPRGGSYFLAVTPGEGVFDVGDQSQAQCTEYSRLLITIYNRLVRDRTDEDEELLLEETAGLMHVEQRVLHTLLGHDLELADGTNPLRNLIYGVRSTAPQLLALATGSLGLQRAEGGQFVGRSAPRELLGCLQLEFGVDFDWELD